MRLVEAEDDPITLPEGHRFPLGKYRAVARILAREHPELMCPAPRASWDDLALAHDRRYLDRVREGALEPSEVRRLGFPWSEALVLRGRRSVGGTLAALDWAVAHGAAGHLAGGTHHAFRDRGEGFCVFNDLAVAALSARRDHGIRRVAIVDLDVHQGNGTAAIFSGDPDVLSLSLHGLRNYPFKKELSSLDIALGDGTADDAYLRALDVGLRHVRAFAPEIVLYQAGVDALDGDRLGRLALSLDGMRRRDARVFDLVDELDVPIVVTLGGGYGRQIERTIEAHANVYRGLAARFAHR